MATIAEQSSNMVRRNGAAYPEQIEARVRVTDASRLLVRTGRRILGAALMFSAVVVWFAPGLSWEPEILLVKLVIAMVAALAGMGLWMAGAPVDAPRAEIDLVRHELRLVRGQGPSRRLILRRRFRDLGAAQRDGLSLKLWDRKGTLLADVSLTDRRLRRVVLETMGQVGVLEQ